MAATLDSTIGALEVGSALGIFLFGVVVLQAHVYYSLFRDDKWQLKLMVGVVCVLELMHTICIAAEVYSTTITRFGHPELLNRFQFLAISLVAGGGVTLHAHAFFSYQIWNLLPRPYHWSAAALTSLASARFVATLYTSAVAVQALTIQEFQAKYTPLVLTLFATSAAIDITIAATMLWYTLNRARPAGAMGKPSRGIERLINVAIRTGLLTCLVSVTNMITFKVLPDTLIWAAFYAFLEKIYSNSILSALNGRAPPEPDHGGAIVDASEWLPSARTTGQCTGQLSIAIEMVRSTQVASGRFGRSRREEEGVCIEEEEEEEDGRDGTAESPSISKEGFEPVDNWKSS